MDVLIFVKEFLGIIVGLAGVVALFYGAYSYQTSKKQLNFAVIVSCTERFQKITPKLNSIDEKERQEAIKQYLDLCNEELFYFRHGYLPEEIIDEWLDGMIYYLPHFDGENNLNKNEECLLEIIEMLNEYPRVKESFKVSSEFDLSKRAERKELVKIVKTNLRKTKNH